MKRERDNGLKLDLKSILTRVEKPLKKSGTTDGGIFTRSRNVAIRLKKWDLIFNFGTFSKYDHISLESKLLTLFGLKSIFRLLYRRVSSVVVVSL